MTTNKIQGAQIDIGGGLTGSGELAVDLAAAFDWTGQHGFTLAPTSAADPADGNGLARASYVASEVAAAVSEAAGDYVPVAAFEAAGDLLVGDGEGVLARLAAGSPGDVLTVDGGEGVPAWIAPDQIPASLIEARGDMIVGDASGDPARLTLGTVGQVLTSDGIDAGWDDLPPVPATPATTVKNSLVVWDDTTGTALGESPLVYSNSALAGNVVQILVSLEGSTDTGLCLTPEGNGALTAGPPPDGGTTGGNARGNFAVDLSMDRAVAADIALGNWSTIGGGRSNRTSAAYATVGGGQTNRSTGIYATIGGGNGNDATNQYATIPGGQNNTASSTFSTVGGGGANTSSGQYAVVVGGQDGLASSGWASVLGGRNNHATASYSAAMGRDALADRLSEVAHAAGRFSTRGDAQYSRMIARVQTTDATATDATLNGSAPGATNRIVLPDNTAMAFTAQVVARSSTGSCASFKVEGLIRRGSGAATTEIVGDKKISTPIKSTGASAWDVDFLADATNGALRVVVEGEAATTIKWVCRLACTRVSG